MSTLFTTSPALHTYSYIPSWKFPERLPFSLSEHCRWYFKVRLGFERQCYRLIHFPNISGIKNSDLAGRTPLLEASGNCSLKSSQYRTAGLY